MWKIQGKPNYLSVWNEYSRITLWLQSCIEDLTWGAPDILVSRKTVFMWSVFPWFAIFRAELRQCGFSQWVQFVLAPLPPAKCHIWFLLLHLIAEYQIYLGSISKILFLMCPSIIVWNLIQSKHKSSLFILHWLWHFRKWDSS